MNSFVSWLIVLWACFMVGFMIVGGYFMFRKFLKGLPQRDGKSKLDWQAHYIEQSLAKGLWTDESRAFLNELVSPVPQAFRDVAKQTIAAGIAKLALERGAEHITREICIEGYIVSTPKRDHKSLVTYLERNQIDYTAYQHML